MDYINQYKKYKNEYLKLKHKSQSGGSLTEDLSRAIQNMTIFDLFKVSTSKQYFVDTILSTKKLSESEFSKISFIKELGAGAFGQTQRILVSDDIIKDGIVIIPKGTLAIAKVMTATEERKKYFTSEIVSHALINKTDCGLPKIYGFFENVIYDGKNSNVIIAEIINGKNLLKELTENTYDIMNSEHFYFITVWINRLENTVRCLHKNGIAHRDIKVDNVMIRYDDQKNATKESILIDYGLSCKYISLCLPEMYQQATSPIKYIETKNKTRTIDTEMLNDNYALGILILDVLSLVIDKQLFHQTITREQLKVSKLNFDSLMTHINEFVNKILTKYPILKMLTDKAYKNIKLGLSEKELPVLESGISDKEPTLQRWYATQPENELNVNLYSNYPDLYSNKNQYGEISSYKNYGQDYADDISLYLNK